MALWTFVETIRETLDQIIQKNSKAVLIGSGIGPESGFMRSTEGLLKKHDHSRVIDMPADGWGIVGTAIGMALAGLRPIVELTPPLLMRGGIGQILTELGGLRYRSSGSESAPMIIRIPYGPSASRDHLAYEISETLLAGIPGIRTFVPGSSADEREILLGAMDILDPIIILEPLLFYFDSAKSMITTEKESDSITGPKLEREGKDLTILTWGSALPRCLEAASQLEQKNRSVDIISIRALAPLEDSMLITSFKKTGRALVVSDSKATGGWSAELASLLAEKGTDYIQAPIRRLGGLDVPPSSRYLRKIIPSADDIRSAAERLIEHK